MGGSKKQSTSSTTTSEPWSKAQPYLERGMAEIDSLFNQGFGQKGYTGSLLADWNPTQELFQQLAFQRGTEGFEPTNIASDYTSSVLRGDYLNPETNPALQNYVSTAMGEIMPGVNSSAQLAGRYGSGAWAGLKEKAASDIMAKAYLGERNAQQDAVTKAMGLGTANLQDLGLLGSLGDTLRGMDQAKLEEAKRIFDVNSMGDLSRWDDYLGLMSGMGKMGGTQTAKGTQYVPSTGMQIFGSAMSILPMLAGGGGGGGFLSGLSGLFGGGNPYAMAPGYGFTTPSWY